MFPVLTSSSPSPLEANQRRDLSSWLANLKLGGKKIIVAELERRLSAQYPNRPPVRGAVARFVQEWTFLVPQLEQLELEGGKVTPQLITQLSGDFAKASGRVLEAAKEAVARFVREWSQQLQFA
jgi:hypothetical protein